MREDRLATLAVPDRPAGEIATDRHAQHERARPRAVRAPADRRRPALDLLHGRPDVIEDPDLGTRLEPAYRLADGAPDDVGLGERRVEAPGHAEVALQTMRRAEHAAVALDLGEHLFRRVGHVLAEHSDALI